MSEYVPCLSFWVWSTSLKIVFFLAPSTQALYFWSPHYWPLNHTASKYSQYASSLSVHSPTWDNTCVIAFISSYLPPSCPGFWSQWSFQSMSHCISWKAFVFAILAAFSQLRKLTISLVFSCNSNASRFFFLKSLHSWLSLNVTFRRVGQVLQ